MGAVHIVFIVLNLAVPSWLYFRTSNENPKLNWSKFEDNMERIVASTGDFGTCNKEQIVDLFVDLCERSMDEWTSEDSVIMERAAANIVFTCEVRNDASFVQWRLEPSEQYDLNCHPARKLASESASPAFVFDKQGELTAIEFFARNGDRQSINTKNCRRKLELALKKPAHTGGSNIADSLPRLKSDPRDHVTANRMCFEYDVAEDWSKLRARAAQ